MKKEKPSSIAQGRFQFQEKPSRLRLARIEKQWSQIEMAKKIDRAFTTYGEIERGRRPVHAETADRIADLFGKKRDLLFSELPKNKFVARKQVA